MSGLLLTIKAEDGDLQKIETLLNRLESVLDKPVKADLSKLTAQVAALDKEAKEASLSAANMQANLNSLSAKSLKTAQDISKLTGNLKKNEAVINVLTASFSAYVAALSKSDVQAEKVLAAQQKQRAEAQALLGAMERLSVTERQKLVTDQALVGVTNLLNKEMAVQVELATIEAASKSTLIASMRAETVAAAGLLLQKGLISEARYAGIAGIQKEIPAINILTASYAELALAEQASAAAFRSNIAAQLGATRTAKKATLSSKDTNSVINARAEEAALETRNRALAEGVRLKALMVSSNDKVLPSLHRNNQALATQARRLGLITKEEYKTIMAQKVFTASTKQAAFSADRLTSALRGISGGLGALWLTYGAMMPMLIAFAAVTAAVKSLKAASNFEYQIAYMVSLGKATKDATATYENLYEGILAISGVAQSPTELADSVKVLMKAGFDASTALTEVTAIAQLATTAEEGLSEVTSALMSQYRAWSVEMVGPERGLRSLAEAANVIGYAALDTTLDIKEMLGQFKYTSELAKLSGASFVEVAAGLGLMSDMGIKGTKAATSLRTAIRQLQNPTTRTRKLLKEMKIDFDLYAKDGTLLTVTQLFSNLAATLKDLPDADRMKVLTSTFSLRAASAGSMLTAVSIDDLKRIDEEMQAGNFSFAKRVEILEQIKKEGSFVANMYKDLAKTNKILWEETQAAWEKAAIKGTGTKDLKDLILSLKDLAEDGTVQGAVASLMVVAKALFIASKSFIDFIAAPAGIYNAIQGFVITVEESFRGVTEATLAAMNAQGLYQKQLEGTLGGGSSSKQNIEDLSNARKFEKIYGSLKVAAMAAPLDKKIAGVSSELKKLEAQVISLGKSVADNPTDVVLAENYTKAKEAVTALIAEIDKLFVEKAKLKEDPEAWKAGQEAAAAESKKINDILAEYKTAELDKVTIAKFRRDEQKAQDAFEIQMLGDQHRAKEIAEEDHKNKVYQIKRQAVRDDISLLTLERDAAAEAFKEAEEYAGSQVAEGNAKEQAMAAKKTLADFNSQLRIAQKEFSQLATLRISDRIVTDVTNQREYIATSLELRKSQIDREKTLTMTSIKQEGQLLEAKKKAGLIVESEYIEEKRKLHEQEFDAEEVALTEQVNWLKDKRAEMMKLPGVKETDADIRKLDDSITNVAAALKAVEAERGVFDELINLEAIARAEKLREELEKIVKASNEGLAGTMFDLSIRTQAPKKQEQSRELRGIELDKKQKISELGDQYKGKELEDETRKIETAYAQITKTAEASFALQAAASQDFWGGLEAGMNGYLESSSDIFTQASDFASSSFDKMSTALADFVATGKMDFKSLAQSIIADAAQMMIKLMLVKAMQAAIGGGGWAGSLVSIGSSLFGSGAGGAPAAAANGAIWDGHFQAIQGFASGATNISKPTVGVIGEGKYPEAIVPLPDGRSIPARIEGLGDSMDKVMDKLASKINSSQGQGGTKIVNVLDPSMVKGYLSTREGEKLIVNIMRENKGAFT
jgi:TP901 family phage tail tape measure protein/lambda family phage tail tape measure protein